MCVERRLADKGLPSLIVLHATQGAGQEITRFVYGRWDSTPYVAENVLEVQWTGLGGVVA